MCETNNELLAPNLKNIVTTLNAIIFKSQDPLVVSLTGGWGEGKTYFWKKVITKDLKSERHGYVSVFNSESLNSIRESIILASIESNTDKEKTSLVPFVQKYEKYFKFYKEAISNFRTYISSKFGISGSLLNRALESVSLKKNWILCIDDVERLPQSVDIGAFMGYVSSLKEEYGLKVVLIYNYEEIHEDRLEQFNAYFEKVVDRNIVFMPDIDYVIRKLMVGNHFSDEIINTIINCCKVINLNNLRILDRAKKYFLDVIEQCDKNIDEDFKSSLITSLLLFCQVKFSPRSCNDISFEFLKNWHALSSRLSRNDDISSVFNEETDEDKTTQVKEQILNDISYIHTSELDLILMDYVQTSVLDLSRLRNELDTYTNNTSFAKLENIWRAPWRKYFHGSLKNNAEEFCAELANVTHEYIEKMPINEVDTNLKYLSELGYENEAERLLDEFIEKRMDELSEYDQDYHRSRATYSRLEEILNRAYEDSQIDNRSVGEVIRSALSEDEIISGENLEKFNEFSASQIYEYFMENDQDHITSNIRHLVKITNFANSEYEPFREKLIAVANLIAEQSTINRLRMEAMGLVPN